MTVGSKGGARLVAVARERAARWGLPYLERTGPLDTEPARALLVLAGDGWSLREGGQVLRFTPGMAALRIQRLRARRDEDLLVRHAQLGPGDRVLDCTFGLGADALVSAAVAVPGGEVVGLEASKALWALASAGLERDLGLGPLAPLTVHHADHRAWLRAAPTRSFDVVLLDPMFGRPRKSSPAFELLRRHAEPGALSAEALAEARRVVRRWVLVKGARDSADLKALGLQRLQTSRSATVAWARVGPLDAP